MVSKSENSNIPNMTTLKITKKHHKHLNNPFPSPPKSLPYLEGSLLFNPETQIFRLGTDFQFLWSTKNGGYISISHHSHPTKSLWSTLPGQAFVSAAVAETEVEESRGSFVINDTNLLLLCDHQTIEDIKLIPKLDQDFDSPFDFKDTQFPSELIECFTETIGRPPELPKWIISGAVVGMQGGTEAVHHIWNELKSYKVPISAFWLQDWVGQRETFIGSQLWWNWEVDTTRYNGWKQLINDLGAQHIKVMAYCNPCLAPTDEKPNRRRNHFQEAKELDILVKDKNGDPYMVPNTAFDVGMLDLTHPNTACWFKQILQEMVDDGVRGWMADFGEGLPVDAVLYSGEDPISAHNRYPELWAQLNREFVEHWKKNRVGKEKEDPEEALVFFMRAGFRDSPKWGMLFWEGDQMVSWQANDGIKSAVVGLLSSGLSGYALNHSDIGGYCAVSMPFIKYHRSEELLMRWMELNAFTTVFRTHEGNKPSCNSQFYSNHKTLSHFAHCAKMYKAWYFYRIQLVKEASQKGLPVCRHLFLHYPNDRHVHRLSYQQFLIGTEILVVPVLDKGKQNVKAYFPEGETCSWKHVWSGKLFTEEGSEVWVEAPVGYPAIFIKAGSLVGETFLKNLRNLGVL